MSAQQQTLDGAAVDEEPASEPPSINVGDIGTYYNKLVDLRDHERANGDFSARDLEKYLADELNNLSARDIVIQTGLVDPPEASASNEQIKEYRINPRALDELDALDIATFPCGHRGFRNYGSAGYGCQFEHCDARYGEDAAREVLGQ